MVRADRRRDEIVERLAQAWPCTWVALTLKPTDPSHLLGRGYQSMEKEYGHVQQIELSCKELTCKLMSTLIEGSLEVKLPAIWTDERQRWEESERREE